MEAGNKTKWTTDIVSYDFKLIATANSADRKHCGVTFNKTESNHVADGRIRTYALREKLISSQSP